MVEKGKSNMYEITSGKDGDTVNPLRGRCPHFCNYCFVVGLMDRFATLRTKYTGKLGVDKNGVKKIRGKGKTLFICSCNDLFAEGVPDDAIKTILERCRKYPDNQYWFQSKNPIRFLEFKGLYPDDSIFCTTIETDVYPDGFDTNAPPPSERLLDMVRVKDAKLGPIAVTIEPIMKMNIGVMVYWLSQLQPEVIHIGADSDLVCQECGHIYRWNGSGKCTNKECRIPIDEHNTTNIHKLMEPTKQDVVNLVTALEVNKLSYVLKDNIKRILGGGK